LRAKRKRASKKALDTGFFPKRTSSSIWQSACGLYAGAVTIQAVQGCVVRVMPRTGAQKMSRLQAVITEAHDLSGAARNHFAGTEQAPITAERWWQADPQLAKIDAGWSTFKHHQSSQRHG
jgi:hypothetical protein